MRNFSGSAVGQHRHHRAALLAHLVQDWDLIRWC
jgi:hypothetical protein